MSHYNLVSCNHFDLYFAFQGNASLGGMVKISNFLLLHTVWLFVLLHLRRSQIASKTLELFFVFNFLYNDN